MVAADIVAANIGDKPQDRGQGRASLGSPRVDAQLSLIGERLNEFNRLLAVEWPALGPYSLSGHLMLANGTASATDVKAMLGAVI